MSEQLFCGTGKQCYANSKEASIAAANLSRQFKKQKFSIYKCSECGCFHTNTVKKKKFLIPKKIDKYPIRFTMPVKEESKSKNKKNKKRWRRWK